jgi:hypothetical protein
MQARAYSLIRPYGSGVNLPRHWGRPPHHVCSRNCNSSFRLPRGTTRPFDMTVQESPHSVRQDTPRIPCSVRGAAASREIVPP